jgi:calcineurin-like phosphoesterase family protein
LGLYRRPFASVAAMNEAIIERWNEIVGPDDEVWHLGDFAIHQRPAVVAKIFARLHGRKHLVTGNNAAGYDRARRVGQRPALHRDHRRRRLLGVVPLSVSGRGAA